MIKTTWTLANNFSQTRMSPPNSGQLWYKYSRVWLDEAIDVKCLFEITKSLTRNHNIERRQWRILSQAYYSNVNLHFEEISFCQSDCRRYKSHDRLRESYSSSDTPKCVLEWDHILHVQNIPAPDIFAVLLLLKSPEKMYERSFLMDPMIH